MDKPIDLNDRRKLVEIKVDQIIQGIERKDAHLAALENLAAAINQLAQALTTSFQPPRTGWVPPSRMSASENSTPRPDEETG